mgnify:CR=1 FL=1
MLYRFLFPVRPEGAKTSLLLLAARVIFGVLLMSHGLQKWAGFAQMADVFPDPLGVGSRFSLMLAIFGELVCSFGFLRVGLFDWFHLRCAVSFGDDPDDFYDGDGLFRDS